MAKQIVNHGIMKEANKRIILSLVNKNDYSPQDISRNSGLSYTGGLTIINEMMKEQILIKVQDKNVNGRNGMVLKINGNFGCFAVIRCVGLISVTIYSCDCTEVANSSFYYDKTIKREDIEKTKILLKNILETTNLKLFFLVIAAPGKINKITGKFTHSPTFENAEELNLKEEFSKFNVPVEIKNDIRFSIIAEKTYGEHSKQMDNSIYMQLLEGMGCAMYLNGKLYEGSNGLNGELGYYIVDILSGSSNIMSTEDNAYFMHKASIKNIIKSVKYAIHKGEKSVLKEDFSLDELVDAYINDDKLCCDIIDTTAKIVADVIKSLAEILDFSSVIISRNTLFFGKKYVDVIINHLSRYNELSHVDIFLSTFGGESVELGAKAFAFENVISELAKL